MEPFYIRVPCGGAADGPIVRVNVRACLGVGLRSVRYFTRTRAAPERRDIRSAQPGCYPRCAAASNVKAMQGVDVLVGVMTDKRGGYHLS